jgi:hypothetical protein
MGGGVDNEERSEMTREVILNMPAGDELDELVAEKVMQKWQGHAAYGLFNPSTIMPDAWRVVEKIMEIDSHWSPGINWDDDDGDGNPMWCANFTYYGESGKDYRLNEVWDKSAPLAICRAALLAVMNS